MMWLFVLLMAIGIGLMLIVQESPVLISPDSLNTEYNLIDLNAPALTGLPLTVFAYVCSKTILRPFVIRLLFRKNDMDAIRQLAANLPDMVPTYYPVARLNAQDYNVHVEAAASSQDTLVEGLPEENPSTYRSVMDYHRLYLEGKATPSMVMEKVLEGCEKLKHLNMFSSLIPDDVRKQARESDERYKLGKPLSVFDGVPIAAKEQFHALGHQVCLGGSVCTESLQDDAVVTTIRQAGAILLGLTVMTEGGVTPLGYSLAFDGPFNPYDSEYYSGGSSSGSAVAVATGLVPVAIGADGGGSIRVPAAMTGTFGLAPTFGRVQSDASLSSTVIKTGPIAASTQDTALAHLLLGDVADKEHFYAKLYDGGVLGQPPAHLSSLRDSVKGMRLGIFWDHFQDSDPEVVQTCVQVVEFLKDKGAEIVNITIPHLREIHMSHAIKIMSEFGRTWDSKFYNPEIKLEANTELTVVMGKTLSAVEVLAGEKIRTLGLDIVRRQIFRDQKIDAIISPSLGTKVPKPMKGFRSTGESNTALVYKVMRYVPLVNFLGLPGLSIPVGYEKDTGLPIGFQIMGDAWMEHKLLQIATTVESQFLKRRKPSTNYIDPLSEWLNQYASRGES